MKRTKSCEEKDSRGGGVGEGKGMAGLGQQEKETETRKGKREEKVGKTVSQSLVSQKHELQHIFDQTKTTSSTDTQKRSVRP